MLLTVAAYLNWITAAAARKITGRPLVVLGWNHRLVAGSLSKIVKFGLFDITLHIAQRRIAAGPIIVGRCWQSPVVTESGAGSVLRRTTDLYLGNFSRQASIRAARIPVCAFALCFPYGHNMIYLLESAIDLHSSCWL